MSTPPDGTVTFLFTDIEGSTRLWENNPQAMRADLARHDTLLREAFTRHAGYIFKSLGDAFCVAFARAQDAIEAALAAQQALRDEPWQVGGTGLRVRMALYTGEAEQRDGDYFGPPLNRTARLLAAGHGGQVLLSQTTEAIIWEALPASADLRDLGRHPLRDIARPEEIFQLLHPRLLDEFPRLRTLATLPNNLPQRLDSFIGRERDLAEVKRLLSARRLITLIGVGGAGKTRLAQQAAMESVEQFPDGVWQVSLEALTDAGLVAQEVGAAVGAREQPGRPLSQTLCEMLAPQQVLLLLDNCEHLIGACADIAERLLQSCPRLRILATSREALEIGGEAAYPVAPLAVPAASHLLSPERLTDEYESVRLFVDRATLIQPSFVLNAQNAGAVTRICRRLDGIPLAIELAAPRVRMLTPEQIAHHLENDFRLLTGGRRTALPRQQTMLAAIQWSHDLLSEPERDLFRRLSVFAGGWTLEAAEEVCAGDGLEAWDVLDLLSRLVSKSLVQAGEQDGEARYRMIETLRQYSWERLHASPEVTGVRDRHGDWFLALAERAEPQLRGPEQGRWLSRLETEHDNLRAALAWAAAPETRLRLGAALHRFWLTRGYLTEGRRWLQEALARAEAAPPAVHAKALNAAGVLAWAKADYEDASSLHQQALAIYEQTQDRPGVAKTLMNFGIISDYKEDYENARRNYESSLTLYRELGEDASAAFVQVNLAAHFLGRNDPASALPLLRECLDYRRRVSDRAGIATVLYNFGQAAYQMGDWAEARRCLTESLAIRRELSDERGMAASLFHLACTLHGLGDHRQAATLIGAAERLRESLGLPLQLTDRSLFDQVTQGLVSNLGEETYQLLWRGGQALSTEQAIQIALQPES